MARNSLSAVAIFALLVACGVVAMAEPARIAHDDVTQPLDARYHELPQALVDKLKARVPNPPHPSPMWCFGPDRSPDKTTAFCVCYSEQGCRDLKASPACEAKLGAIKENVAVCRSRVETVTLG